MSERVPFLGLMRFRPSGPRGLRRSVGQGLGTAGDDAVPKGDNPGQRVLTLPVAPDPLDRGAAARSGFVQALEGEQVFGEALFEGGEGFGGAGHEGGCKKKKEPKLTSAVLVRRPSSPRGT